MTKGDIERRLRDLEWPEPPPELRKRTLAAAPHVVDAVTWSDRVWFSRGWRLAATMVVILTLVVEAFSSAIFSSRSVETTHVSADAKAVDDLGRDVGLPSAVTAAFARRVASDGRPTTLERQAQELEGVAR